MKNILKIIAVGSVDDGKSSLIGRLLYDNNSVYNNQIDDTKNNNKFDLSRLTDGLKSERELGITIDVAYKYFNTSKRKVILIDSPGHTQYIKNMVTGASNANVSLILIDAKNGISEQTRRHFFICNLLGIKHFIVCINKMDLVDYSEEVFNKIISDFSILTEDKNDINIIFIPTNAVDGDNVVNKSNFMPWYSGKTLLQNIDEINIQPNKKSTSSLFCIQTIIKSNNYLGYAGKVLSGNFNNGDEIIILPSKIKSKIKSIEFNGEELNNAEQDMSIIIKTDDSNIKISRGNIISKINNQPEISDKINVDLCWLDKSLMFVGNEYILQKNNFSCLCIIKEILYKINIDTLKNDFNNNKHFILNDIGRVIIKTSEPIVFDEYEENKDNGSFILVDKISKSTVGACLIRRYNA